jgi:HEAT repeat protein
MILPVAWLAGLGLVVLAFVEVRRRVQLRRRRHQYLDQSAWAALMVLLAEGSEVSTVESALDPAILRRLDALACSLVVNLRGEDRAVLAHVLETRGVVALAQRRTHSWRARRRARAAELLGAATSTPAFPDLVRLLGDRSARVRVAAAGALGRTGDPYAAALLLAAMEGRRALPLDVVAAAILETGEPPANLLSQGLRSSSAPARTLTAELLGAYQVMPATAELAHALAHDECPDVRLRAAGALARIDTEEAAVALSQAKLFT